jgi:hypothetical protein
MPTSRRRGRDDLRPRISWSVFYIHPLGKNYKGKIGMRVQSGEKPNPDYSSIFEKIRNLIDNLINYYFGRKAE